jgi:hypothetical protein
MERQKRIGWLLIICAGAYLIYFLKTRLLTAGPFIERKEWFYAVSCVILLVLGTINVRMAAQRERARKAALSNAQQQGRLSKH